MSNNSQLPVSTVDAGDHGSATVINIPYTTTTVTINTQNITLIAATTTKTPSNPSPSPSPTTITTTPTPHQRPQPITNLANLLPTSTVLMLQAITPFLSIFNTLLTAFSVSVIAAFCFLSSFTDSFADPNDHRVIHYGFATRKGLFVFRWSKEDAPRVSPSDLAKFRLWWGDLVHAVVSVLILLAVAFSDSDVQFRLFPESSRNEKEMMTNLPLAAWVFANFLFTLMPATRRGVGFADKPASTHVHADTPITTTRPETKMLTAMGNLANLLPTGTVLAFQALTPSFSNSGHCDISNRYFTATAIALNALICFVSCFTDSVRDPADARLYHGLATPSGLYTFSASDEVKRKYMATKKYRMCCADWVHAFVSLFVFLAIAVGNREVHRCYFPEAEEQRRLLAAYLPVGASIFAGCLFALVPTRRRGIGYSDVAPNKI